MIKQIKPTLNFVMGNGIFTLMLGLGVIAALIATETTGLALTDLSQASVQSMTTTAEDNVLFIVLDGGPQPDGVYRSHDNGLTWQHLSREPDLGFNVLAAHPSDATILYGGSVGGPAATANSLWRSEDGGKAGRNFAWICRLTGMVNCQ